MIRLEHVDKTFNAGKDDELHVLQDICLEFPDRGMYALCGKSGSGKTTLLNAIGGLTDIDSGEIYIGDKPVLQENKAARIRQIGYIFQNYCLSEERSCIDNVADVLRIGGMVDEEKIRELSAGALASVGMLRYSERLPQTLSGGQQQRVAIARAIVKNPKLVLADEPTGNLDEKNKEVVMDLLHSISRKYLVIVVTHDTEIVDRYCDGVVWMRDGEVSALTMNCPGAKDSERNQQNDYADVGMGLCDENRCGKLFHWKDSIIRGWRDSIGSAEGQRTLRWCLVLLSMLLVFMTSQTLRVVRDCVDLRGMNNRNVFYGYIENEAAAEKIKKAVADGTAGLTKMAFSETPIGGDSFLSLQYDAYESSLVSDKEQWLRMSPHGAMLPERMLCSAVVQGKANGLTGNEIIITTAFAEQMMTGKPTSVLSDPEILIGFGMHASDYFQIVGFVASDEPALYVSDTYFAAKRYAEEYPFVDFKADSSVESGSVVLIRNKAPEENDNVPEGRNLLINGRALKIAEIRDVYFPYDMWLSTNMKESKRTQEDYCREQECSVYEYWDYYFAEYAEYLNYCKENQDHVYFDSCMALACAENKYAVCFLKEKISGLTDYYYASMYFDEHGKYPEDSELVSCYEDYPELLTKLEDVLGQDESIFANDIIYLMNEEDYVSCAASFGKTIGYGIRENLNPTGYVILYTENSGETDAHIRELFSAFDKDGFSYMSPLQEASKRMKQMLGENTISFILYGLLISAVVFILQMVIKSNIIKKGKTLVMYQYLGVTRRNIVFRFCVETLVLITVVAGFWALLSGAGLILLQNTRYGVLIADYVDYSWIACFCVPLALVFVGFILSVISINVFFRRDTGEILSE